MPQLITDGINKSNKEGQPLSDHSEHDSETLLTTTVLDCFQAASLIPGVLNIQSDETASECSKWI